jgi:hypothetical protein
MQKIGKIVFVIIILFAILTCACYSYASIVNPIEDPDHYNPGVNSESDNSKFIDIGSKIIGTIRTIGTALSVIALMVIGIKYMMASTGDKASYKEAMIPYLIGAIMIFTIPNIIGILYDFITSNITL